MRILPLIPAVRPSLPPAVGGIKVALAAGAVVLVGVMLSGCVTTKAATVTAGPPLMVPEPPPRVLVPAEEEPLAATALGPDTPVTSVPRVQQNPPTTRRPAPVRSETDARGETPSGGAAVGPASPAEAPRELRALSPAESAAEQQQVQVLLNRAAADLKRVDYGKLSTEGKNNYDDSKRFSEQAWEKLKERNVSYALSAAQKAATLAAALVGR